MPDEAKYSTVDFRVEKGVAVVTLDRPDVYNAYNAQMEKDLAAVWRQVRTRDDIAAAVLTGAGQKAFCTGVDRNEIPADTAFNPYTYDDPGLALGPRANRVWKPVIGAVNGLAGGGAFYLLGECDFLVASDTATFFDPHVTFGMAAVFEPILMLPRMPFGEAMRMTLMGTAERITAQKALDIGLVSEVVPAEDLQAHTFELAAIIASYPTAAVQASIRTGWAAREIAPRTATELGSVFLQLSTTPDALQAGQETFENAPRRKPRFR